MSLDTYRVDLFQYMKPVQPTIPRLVAMLTPCPSWCADRERSACGGDHMSTPLDVPATAGGFAVEDDGAKFPMVTAYAAAGDDKPRRVVLSIQNPLKDSTHEWCDAPMTSEEARLLARALTDAALLADTN
jgi:hypothetical protein